MGWDLVGGSLDLVRRGWTEDSSVVNRANGRTNGLNVKCERRKATRMPLVCWYVFLNDCVISCDGEQRQEQMFVCVCVRLGGQEIRHWF